MDRNGWRKHVVEEGRRRRVMKKGLAEDRGVVGELEGWAEREKKITSRAEEKRVKLFSDGVVAHHQSLD